MKYKHFLVVPKSERELPFAERELTVKLNGLYKEYLNLDSDLWYYSREYYSPNTKPLYRRLYQCSGHNYK